MRFVEAKTVFEVCRRGPTPAREAKDGVNM